MNKSDNIAALAAALVKAQGEIKGAAKDAKNPHYKSQYATLESVVDAVRAPFAKYGLAYTQLLGDGGNDVLIETVLLHESGEWLSQPFRIPAPKHDPQGYGSAVTYGRRYALAALAGIAQVDDDGEAARVASDKPSFRHPASQVATDEFAALPDEAQQVLREAAMEIIALTAENNMPAVMQIVDEMCVSQEDKLALWSLLPSASRSAIKKATAERKAA